MLRPRNFAARSPLLRKGGVHKESKSAIRSQSRQVLDDQILDWEIECDAIDEKQIMEDENRN